MRAANRRWLIGVLSAVVLASISLDPPTAGAQPPPPGKVRFAVPSLFPTYGPNAHDYTVRCRNRPVAVKVHASAEWEVAVGSHAFQSGDFSAAVGLGTGQAFEVVVRKVGGAPIYRYHVRCLPQSFPTYTFTRYGRGVSPSFFSADQYYVYRNSSGQYATIFDSHGAPIWWYHTPAWDTRVLPNGNVLWFDRSVSPGRWTIHALDGRLLRTLGTVGRAANPHDMQPLSNGEFLAGAYVKQSHVDTSAYGGSQDATVINAELQQVDTQGQLVWDWKSQQHISLAETGRRWAWIVNHPNAGAYDILHWNSIEPAGSSVIASFRHLDAVYEIDKSTGKIVWKLGGTKTPKSLTVKGDPLGYTFGAQHDARLLPDGTLTVFDNRTNQANRTPRAVRYRIDEQNRTATLLESIRDPAVHSSHCCGSARRLDNGDWLIDWGLDNGIGGYQPNGARTFSLSFDSNYSYRVEPVPKDAVSAPELRDAMDAMYGTP